MKVMLPLPEDFTYLTYEDSGASGSVGMEALLDALRNNADSFVAYNTACVFEDGLLVIVTHGDYPYGPEDAL